MFISFEGGDGSGKSTQARRLHALLIEHGIDCVITREPGGSPGAEEIRRLVLEGETDRWSAETEILLFTAARRDHLERTILPAIGRGAVVITDRFFDSTLVYQGMRSPELARMAQSLHDLMIGVVPDLTFIMDIDAITALDRGVARLSADENKEDRFEKFGASFQENLRAGFRERAESGLERYKVIDASGSPEDVAARVIRKLPGSIINRLVVAALPTL